MRETRLSGSEGGAGSIPVPTPILADPPSALRPPSSVLRPPSVRFLRLLRCFAANPSLRLRRLQRSGCNGRHRAPIAPAHFHFNLN